MVEPAKNTPTGSLWEAKPEVSENPADGEESVQAPPRSRLPFLLIALLLVLSLGVNAYLIARAQQLNTLATRSSAAVGTISDERDELALKLAANEAAAEQTRERLAGVHERLGALREDVLALEALAAPEATASGLDERTNAAGSTVAGKDMPSENAGTLTETGQVGTEADGAETSEPPLPSTTETTQSEIPREATPPAKHEIRAQESESIPPSESEPATLGEPSEGGSDASPDPLIEDANRVFPY